MGTANVSYGYSQGVRWVQPMCHMGTAKVLGGYSQCVIWVQPRC